MFERPPGCLFLHQGSFIPTFFDQQELKPGRDYDFFPFPRFDEGGSELVIGGGDLFGMG